MKIVVIYSPSKSEWVSFSCLTQKNVFWIMLFTEQLLVANYKKNAKYFLEM